MESNIHVSWKGFFEREKSKPYFSELSKFINDVYKDNDKSVFPPKHQIFKLFEEIALNEIKVVIIGQDPYPTFGHANGIAFSLNSNIKPLAKSLKNIYKEIASDLNVNQPENGDLSFLVNQGVFLINTILTVEEGCPMSHKNKGWEEFTAAVLEFISKECNQLVFLLWGSFAQDKHHLISKRNHLVLSAPHPSPLSAYRGFFGCKHFSKTNVFLKSTNRKEIKWTNSHERQMNEFDFSFK